jgi:hypothetical protein
MDKAVYSTISQLPMEGYRSIVFDATGRGETKALRDWLQ